MPAYAGWLKISAPPEEFAYAIEGYRLLTPAPALAAARALPPVELALGVFLLCGFQVRAAAACSGALLLIFEAALLSAVIRGLPLADCGCFGPAGGSSPAAEMTLDLLLLGCCVLAWKYGVPERAVPQGPTPDGGL